MSKHGDTERFILSLFKDSDEFFFNKEPYTITNIGKPRPSKGECKTDIYILAINMVNNQEKEFKISIKQNDADFLENKMTFIRAKEIFGDNASGVISNSIKSVEKSFLNDNLICFKKYGRTEGKSIKIGWKFELVNKPGGHKSGLMELTNKQKIDVYSGTNLNEHKRNAKVNNEVVDNSGIANYILKVENTTNDLDFYIEQLEPIVEYAIKKDIYFACKAINYRCDPDKWDGNRPLSVYIDWHLKNDILLAKFVMDVPLEIKANEIGKNIRVILQQLGIDSNHFNDLKRHLDGSFNYFE